MDLFKPSGLYLLFLRDQEGRMVECPKEEKVAHGSEKEEGREGITLFSKGTGFETSRARFSMVDVSESEAVSNNYRAFFPIYYYHH